MMIFLRIFGPGVNILLTAISSWLVSDLNVSLGNSNDACSTRVDDFLLRHAQTRCVLNTSDTYAIYSV